MPGNIQIFSHNFHTIITNIIPKNSKINQYGLYDKIVNPGSLVYKPIDYNNQCDLENYCNENYTFVGHILENIYPINVISKYLE